ncbi:MAG: sodium/glutamate symporter, partial [Pseudomonadales bacterium]|nr:sodium/glutamate symporter [Pseudomonadales bacterium]
KLHSYHIRYKVASETPEEAADFTPVESILGTLLCLSLCIAFGHFLNLYLASLGINLPEFLTALMVGIFFTNAADVVKRPLNNRAINLAGEVCLHLFLVMSLMSIQFWTLVNTAGILLVVVVLQMLAISLIAIFLVFRFVGQDYDAAVISSGFIGLGMGATPVAMANMQAITSRYGPSPKAFMIVPLVGAFFIDLSNAAIIKLFGLLPLLQQGLSLPP